MHSYSHLFNRYLWSTYYISFKSPSSPYFQVPWEQEDEHVSEKEVFTQAAESWIWEAWMMKSQRLPTEKNVKKETFNWEILVVFEEEGRGSA